MSTPRPHGSEDLLARVRASFEDHARVTRATFSSAGESIAGGAQLMIETFLPADEDTEKQLREMVASVSWPAAMRVQLSPHEQIPVAVRVM